MAISLGVYPIFRHTHIVKPWKVPGMADFLCWNHHRHSKRRVRSHQLCPRKWRMQRCPETTCPAINKWREHVSRIFGDEFSVVSFLTWKIYWSLKGNSPILWAWELDRQCGVFSHGFYPHLTMGKWWETLINQVCRYHKVWHFMVSNLEVPNFQTKDVWFNKLWMDEAGFPCTAGTSSRLEPPAQDMFFTRSHILDANWIISMRRQLSPPLEQIYQLVTPCWLKTLVGDRNDQCFQLLGGHL